MHQDFPCKFFHTGLTCNQGDNCKFSHQPLNEQVTRIILQLQYLHFYNERCNFKLYILSILENELLEFVAENNWVETVSFQVKAILLKHLESAPKEILGDFPRLSREGAILMINNTARSLAQGQDVANQKIPSLFELNLSAPTDKNNEKNEKGMLGEKQK